MRPPNEESLPVPFLLANVSLTGQTFPDLYDAHACALYSVLGSNLGPLPLASSWHRRASSPLVFPSLLGCLSATAT